ncbi:MAG: DNA polymerase III, partial [Candidatus Omnitrophica bacterium]|nr:DNA polymerase III [Candidatus Omnitrophota bacterium]
MKNLEIAGIFNEIADILEIKGDNPFRIRAYRKAALNLEALTQNLEKLAKDDTLHNISGIGKDLALKIKEYLETGKIKHHQELKKEIPLHFLDLLSVPGIGPKTAKLVYEKLNVRSVSDLEKAARTGKLKELPGFKEKSEENILHGIKLFTKGKERVPLGIALSVASDICGKLKKLSAVKQIGPAGSLRRRKETVRDIDILVSSDKPGSVMDAFAGMEGVSKVLAKGATKSSIRTKENIQVDVRVVEPDSYGAALAYFTGSKAHNICLRRMAMDKGYKINEYGIFYEKTGQKIAGREEKDIYNFFNLPYIE